MSWDLFLPPSITRTIFTNLCRPIFKGEHLPPDLVPAIPDEKERNDEDDKGIVMNGEDEHQPSHTEMGFSDEELSNEWETDSRSLDAMY